MVIPNQLIGTKLIVLVEGFPVEGVYGGSIIDPEGVTLLRVGNTLTDASKVSAFGGILAVDGTKIFT